MYSAEVLEIVCPICRAAVGSKCRGGMLSGDLSKEREVPHIARIIVANEGHYPVDDET